MENFEFQLKRQQAIGMSYGSKALAQVVKDMFKPYIETNDDIYSISEDEKNELLNNVYNFINKTLEVSVEALNETINSLIERTKKTIDDAEKLKDDIDTNNNQNSENINNNNDKE